LENRSGSNEEIVQKVTELNIHLTIERIRRESPMIAELEENEKINIVGDLYDASSGMVRFYE